MCGGFRKSRRSGGESNCVEIALRRRQIRDSKDPARVVLAGVDVRQLIDFARHRG